MTTERTGGRDHAPSEFRYDVFLCHNSVDKEPVRGIAERLTDEYGISCWFDVRMSRRTSLPEAPLRLQPRRAGQQ